MKYLIDTTRCLTVALLFSCVLISPALAQKDKPVSDQPLDLYVSTGDKHYLSSLLAIDSHQALVDTFDMFSEALGVRRVYWRGLQELTFLRSMHARESNFRYFSAIQWFEHLMEDKDLESLAVKLAHERGLEFWGVGTLGDWGNRPNTPGFNDYPSFWEARMRLKNPEWVPVDKHGYRKQGGTISFAYPEARQAMIDVIVDVAAEMDYDGVILLTYNENFSQRYQDEFGYNQPIVDEFMRRYGIDIRYDSFTKYASKSDWYRLRGEYLTQYLRELRAALNEHDIKLGMFINPRTPRKPGNWATLNEEYWTLGNIHFDVDNWVREGIVDELAVYGASSIDAQQNTVDDMRFLTRGLPVEVSALTSSPAGDWWKPYREQGVPMIMAISSEQSAFLRGGFPAQPAERLDSGTAWQKMGVLSRAIAGQYKVPSSSVLPLLKHERVMMRRLAVHALGVMGNQADIVAIEQMLRDPEVAVRGKAMEALRTNNRADSLHAVLDSLREVGVHPLYEMARSTIPRITPLQRDVLLAALDDPDPGIRNIVLRVFAVIGPQEHEVPTIIDRLDDSYRYAAYSAAHALGSARHSEAAVEALINALKHNDAAIANRAAVSLQVLLERGNEYAAAQREQIFSALSARFQEMGDGYDRDDREWGFRPVGNALLSFGDEGQRLLDTFMDQTRDKRLATLAWQVRYFRPLGGENQFHIITEEENERTFARRPMFLKTTRLPRMRTGFESQMFTPGLAEGVGTPNSTVGRWVGFTVNGPTIERGTAASGKQSLKLVRGAGVAVGSVSDPIDDLADYEVLAQVFRATEGSGFVLDAIGLKPGFTKHWSIYINEAGRVHLRDTNNQQWVDSGLTLQPQQWTQVGVRVRRQSGAFSVFLGPSGGADQTEQASEVWLPTSKATSVFRVSLAPQGRDGSVTYIDDIELIERR